MPALSVAQIDARIESMRKVSKDVTRPVEDRRAARRVIDAPTSTAGSRRPVADQRGRRLTDTGYIGVGRHDYEHRLVMMAMIGPEPHPCHWCSRMVSWDGRGPTRLVVDHVDENKTNNRPANLVPACQSCNTSRTGRYKLKWTHCPNGHEYTPENLVASVTEHRRCLTCRRETQRRYKARQRAA